MQSRGPHLLRLALIPGILMAPPCPVAATKSAAQGLIREGKMKYTLLSKWTVLGLTVATGGMITGGIKLLGSSTFAGILLLVGGVLVYGIAWIVAFLDAIQEKRFGWALGLIPLGLVLLGPAVYGLLGPKNTR